MDGFSLGLVSIMQLGLEVELLCMDRKSLVIAYYATEELVIAYML
jgi:hypothetical protein